MVTGGKNIVYVFCYFLPPILLILGKCGDPPQENFERKKMLEVKTITMELFSTDELLTELHSRFKNLGFIG